MEENYIITLAGSSTTPVAGTEGFTKEQCEEWMLENQEFIENEPGSDYEFTGRYVMIPAPVEE